MFENKIIPYFPELSSKLGSITAAILYAELMSCFFETKNKAFSKFLKPCNHKEYEVGKSWVEELGMSETEFRTAFQKIGIAYKSKKEFENAADKFVDKNGEEKYFCSYIDRIERKTYYLRNPKLTTVK